MSHVAEGGHEFVPGNEGRRGKKRKGGKEKREKERGKGRN